MTEHDPRLRQRLQRLSTPAARAGFHEHLAAVIREREHVALRRWRRASIALAAIAAAAIATAGVLAASGGSRTGSAIVDRTYSCFVAPNGGFPKFRVSARVETASYPAAVGMGTTVDVTPGDTNYYSLWLDQVSYKSFPNFGADPKACHLTRRSVPLARSGLPKDATYTPTFLGGFDTWCRVPPGRVDVRLRVLLDGNVPKSATVAVRSEKDGKPVAYAIWSTKRVTSYLSPRCGS